jgi:hypothetical protein
MNLHCEFDDRRGRIRSGVGNWSARSMAEEGGSRRGNRSPSRVENHRGLECIAFESQDQEEERQKVEGEPTQRIWVITRRDRALNTVSYWRK